MNALPILMYHHVSPSPGLVTISPNTFEDHIKTLADKGWKSAGLEVVEALSRNEPIPDKTFVITFDDGYLDNFVHAHPILEKYGMKGVLFIATAWIGEGEVRTTVPNSPSHKICKAKINNGQADEVMLRWSEIERMQNQGTFEFHSHTHTHTRWDQELTDTNQIREKLADDLATSQAILKNRLGITSKHLCWPQGYFDDEYKNTAQSLGFDYLYTTIKKVNCPGLDPQEISRFVTKERPGKWLYSRCWLYSRPVLGSIYSLIRTH